MRNQPGRRCTISSGQILSGSQIETQRVQFSSATFVHFCAAAKGNIEKRSASQVFECPEGVPRWSHGGHRTSPFSLLLNHTRRFKRGSRSTTGPSLIFMKLDPGEQELHIFPVWEQE